MHGTVRTYGKSGQVPVGVDQKATYYKGTEFRAGFVASSDGNVEGAAGYSSFSQADHQSWKLLALCLERFTSW